MNSCIEDCESRAEYVSDGVFRCVSPPRALPDGVNAETVPVRFKLNGQDVFPECIGRPCGLYEEGAGLFTYYRNPVVTSVTPNGGPLADEAFIYVRGSGFSAFAWYPRCYFGKHTVVRWAPPPLVLN